MPLDPDNPREPTNGYTLVGLSEFDVIMLGAGLATPTVRSMAHLALAEWETLIRNADKPMLDRLKGRTGRRAETSRHSRRRADGSPDSSG